METIKDVLDHKGRTVWSIRPHDTVLHALEVLADAGIGALLVITDSGEVVGLFSERDFARHALTHREDLFGQPVSEFMTRELRWAPPEMTIEECMAHMTQARVRHLPVFSEGRLEGVVSIGDVVHATVHEKDLMIEQLEHYIEGSL